MGFRRGRHCGWILAKLTFSVAKAVMIFLDKLGVLGGGGEGDSVLPEAGALRA